MNADLIKSVQGPGFGLTFLYHFALTTLIGAIATMELLHVGASSALPYQYGVALALPVAFISAFTKRTQTLEVTVPNLHTFQEHLQSTLSELGYEPTSALELDGAISYQTFQRIGLARWLSGSIYVAIAHQEAVIASRASVINGLKKKL